MNCRKRGKPGSSKQVSKDVSKSGNEVSKLGDTHGMEYKPVKRQPGWQGSSRVEKSGS
jgi:hypothetical protein